MVTGSLGKPYARSIRSIFYVCMESNILEESTNNSVASRFLVQTLLIILQIVRIWYSCPIDKYENFVTAHMEAAAECIPTKPRAECRVSWESLVVRKKWGNIKIASLLNKRNPTNANVQKLKKAQRELTHSRKNTFKAKSIEKEAL